MTKEIVELINIKKEKVIKSIENIEGEAAQIAMKEDIEGVVQIVMKGEEERDIEKKTNIGKEIEKKGIREGREIEVMREMKNLR